MSNLSKEDRLAAAQADEGRSRLLLEGISDYAIYMLEPGGIVASWNEGARRLTGYDAYELIGQNFSQLYGPEDRLAGKPQEALQTAERNGKFEGEGWYLRKNAERFWANIVIDPIRDRSSKLIGFANIVRDLTERREAEEALRRSEEQLRILIQGVTDYAIFMLDPEGTIVSWNSGAQKIKGYRPDEIIGKHFSQFYTADDRAAGVPQTALETAARTGKYEKEGWRVRKDGTAFFAHVVIDAIRDDDGKVIGFAKVTRDMTERRQSQKALDLAREQLMQSQKLESLGQLTGGIAHDFNNLLMAILGSLEIARNRMPSDSPLLRFIDNAISGAQRGTSLTQRMLAFSRRQDLKLEIIDLRELVQNLTELLHSSLGPSITIETRFPLRLSRVRVDENQLELALLNLAVNARDAMPKGGRIEISARDDVVGTDDPGGLKAGRYVCVALTDEGEGMDEATLVRAMEPFFTTKGAGKGTGLGLSVVHGLAEQSGGRLNLKSRLGKGTTAELWLPAAEGVHSTAQTAIPDKEEKPIAYRRVLAVDDDALVLLNTTAMLEDLGHVVFEAASGKEALEILGRESIDLVITDHAMPQMTGLALAESILEQWPEMPVIVATGYAELPGNGSHRFPQLSKPFAQANLAKAIAAAKRESDKPEL